MARAAVETDRSYVNAPFKLRSRGISQTSINIALAIKTKSNDYDKNKIMALLDNALTHAEFLAIWRLLSTPSLAPIYSLIGGATNQLAQGYNKNVVIRQTIQSDSKLINNVYLTAKDTKCLIDIIMAKPSARLPDAMALDMRPIDKPLAHGVVIIISCPLCHNPHEKTTPVLCRATAPPPHIYTQTICEHQGMLGFKNFIATVVMAISTFKIKHGLPTLPLGIIMDHTDRKCLLSKTAYTKDRNGEVDPGQLEEYTIRKDIFYSFMGFKHLLKYSEEEINDNIRIVHTTLLGDTHQHGSTVLEGGITELNLAEKAQTSLSDYIYDTEGAFDELICWIEHKASRYALCRDVSAFEEIRKNS